MPPKSFSEEKFDLKWQHKLVQNIVEDRLFADQIGEVLSPTMFKLESHKKFVEIFYAHKEEHGSYPSYKILSTVLDKALGEKSSPTLREQVFEVLTDFQHDKNPLSDSKYIQESALEFCKRQKLKETMIESIDLINKSSFDELKKKIDEALLLGSSFDMGHRYIEDFEDRYTDDFRDIVSTGVPQLDAMLKGGHGRGELGIILGGTGAGKSILLSFLSAMAIMLGKNVVYYTLELGAKVIGRRVDASITEISLDDLKDMKDMVEARLGEKAKGQLIIKKYPMNQASVTTIHNHLERLKRTEFIPDVIIVDYLDLLKPTVHRKDKIVELEEISQDLKGLAEIFDCLMWTASQINREGNKSNLVTINDIAAAFSKLFAADFVLAITRTIRQQNEDKATYMIGKNRNGPNSVIFDGTMNTGQVQVEFGNRRGFDEFQQELEERSRAKTAEIKKRVAEKLQNSKSDFTS